MNLIESADESPKVHRTILVVAEPGPVSWTLVRCLGASGPVSPDRLTADVLGSAESVVIVTSAGESGQVLRPLLGSVRRLGHAGYVLVLGLGLEHGRARLPKGDVLVEVMVLPASLADMLSRIATGRGRRLAPEAAAAVQSGYDDDELYTFLRSSLGHSSLASIRRTFTQGQYSLTEGDPELAGRYFDKCGESSRSARNALAGALARLSLKPGVRQELERMELALEEVALLAAQLHSGEGLDKAVSRISGLIAGVREAIDRVAPRREAAGGV